MPWKDDDEEDLVSSRAESLSRADHGKQESRERKAREKGDLLKLQREVLQGQVGAKPQSTEEKPHASEDDVPQTFHTETLKEKEEKQTGKTDKQEDAGTIVERNKQQPEISGEEIQSEPG